MLSQRKRAQRLTRHRSHPVTVVLSVVLLCGCSCSLSLCLSLSLFLELTVSLVSSLAHSRLIRGGVATHVGSKSSDGCGSWPGVPSAAAAAGCRRAARGDGDHDGRAHVRQMQPRRSCAVDRLRGSPLRRGSAAVAHPLPFSLWVDLVSLSGPLPSCCIRGPVAIRERASCILPIPG